MKILVVDDDPVIVKALSSRLQKDGYAITSTTDPKQALEYLQKDNFDLIISDIIMPYMSGIELLTEIKKYSGSTPIILISALDQKELILTAFELGAKDFVVKPINMDELSLRITKYEAGKEDGEGN